MQSPLRLGVGLKGLFDPLHAEADQLGVEPSECGLNRLGIAGTVDHIVVGQHTKLGRRVRQRHVAAPAQAALTRVDPNDAVPPMLEDRLALAVALVDDHGVALHLHPLEQRMIVLVHRGDQKLKRHLATSRTASTSAP